MTITNNEKKNLASVPAAKTAAGYVDVILKPFSEDQSRRLAKMISSCFNESDIDSLCAIHLGVQGLREIAAPAGLLKMIRDMLAWCETDEGSSKLVVLLNGMIAQRPFRSDLKEFIKALAVEGALKLS